MSVLSVRPSLRLLITTVYFGKTADSIEMPFGMLGPLGPRNHVLDGGGSRTPMGMDKRLEKCEVAQYYVSNI